jgi:transaldolase
MSTTKLHELQKLGQSIWLDFISRKLMDSGELDKLIKEGLRGMTSNPTIFEQSISKSSEYDRDIQQGIASGWDAKAIYESLAIADIRRAADALRVVFDESGEADGFVSLEVAPALAHDTAGTMQEARRLWKSVDRPNLMIKVPGTKEGVPAIRTLLSEGLNINITLLFSLEQYREVIEAYMQSLEIRLAAGQNLSQVSSVASFFISRVDNVADKQLSEKNHPELASKAAIANACEAYRLYLDSIATERWKKVKASGARVQRPLWASTSTKNPAYSDILYVQELIAKDTVNTLPPVTLDAFKDHGRLEEGLLRNLKSSRQTLQAIADAGVDINKITFDLIEDGVKKFAESFAQLLGAIEKKLTAEQG